MEFLPLLIGILMGLVLGFLLGFWRSREIALQEHTVSQKRESGLTERLVIVDRELAVANAISEALEATHAAEKRTSEQLRQELRDSFQALAGKALRDNSVSLLERNELQMKPFHEQLKALAEQTRELEEIRGASQGALKHQLQELQNSTKELSLKSESLIGALRGSSQARGQWGENVLQRVFELAGMTEGMHYRAQATTYDGQRPDFLVLLPGGDAIPVDSKVPMAAFLDAQAQQDPIRRKEFLAQHAKDVLKHVRALERKEYFESVEGDIDFTVMFLPGDHLLEAAYQAMPRLQEEAMERKVLIATPVTLLALLRTVSLYWKQESLAKNATHIAALAKDYHARMRKFSDHLGKTGKGLNAAVTSFNAAISSYNSRILPQGRRLEELAAIDHGNILDEPVTITLEARDDVIAATVENKVEAGS